MFNTCWRKVLRDIWLYLPRTLLVILAIATGLFGVGFILDTYAILTREIETNFMAANPPSATLWMDTVDAGAVNTARNFPGVADAEAARSPVRGRVQVGPNQWVTFLLFAVDDFNDVRIAKFFPESGDWPPDDRQILIERESLSDIKAAAGEAIVVKTLDGMPHELPITGTVWDPGQDPAWVNGIAYGYITPSTLAWLGAPPAPAKGLRIVLSENSLDRSQILDAANRLSAALQQDGRIVQRVEVPLPGKYQQTDRINSFLFSLAAFGLLCLILSGFMSATLISALLSQQVRQIGVMKAIGASTRQVMGVYFGTVLLLSLAAMAIAVPLGYLAGQAFALPVLSLLNFNVTSSAVLLWIYLVQIALGAFVPLVTAVYPIYRGSRITVREAIGDYGMSLRNFGGSRFDGLLAKVRGLPRLLSLSLRNTFRRRGRMALTMVMLAAGGASFIAALGAAASWNRAIDNAFAYINYDIEIRFGQSYAIDVIEQGIRTIPGVTEVEAWGYGMSKVFPKYSDGTYGGPLAVHAPPTGTALISPPAVEGRWLQPGDTNALVLDTNFIDKAEKQGTPVRVGEKLTFNLNGQDTTWRVVGIVDKIGVQSAAYAKYDYFTGLTRQPGLAAAARVAVAGRDKTLTKTVVRALERRLAENGLNVFVIQDLAFSRRIMVNHILIILVLLMLMSILLGAVGALGLASTMSVNIMERTREFGIMRSVGAATKTILQSVVMEGVLIGVLSWLIGSIISIPVTAFIAKNAGQFIFPRVMDIVIPLRALVLWLVIVLVVAAAASFYPAWRAARLTVREVLAYE